DPPDVEYESAEGRANGPHTDERTGYKLRRLAERQLRLDTTPSIMHHNVTSVGLDRDDSQHPARLGPVQSGCAQEVIAHPDDGRDAGDVQKPEMTESKKKQA